MTPPDIITQIMLAAPMMVLYEISIMGARVFGRSRQAEDPDAQKTAGNDNNSNKDA